MTLRWKKDPRETGLRSIGAGPRSSWLREDGEVRVACVSALRNGHDVIGWYFVVGWDSEIPLYNACGSPLRTEAEAKQKAMEYVKKARAAAEIGRGM
jgi:hypothetical protein